jgi:uncharacterized protein (DUF885 family)
LSHALGGVLALALLAAPAAASFAATTPATAEASASEAARLTAFLDTEFEQDLKANPQQATSLGRKEGMDRLTDISEAAELKRLEWRRGSLARWN